MKNLKLILQLTLLALALLWPGAAWARQNSIGFTAVSGASEVVLSWNWGDEFYGGLERATNTDDFWNRSSLVANTANYNQGINGPDVVNVLGYTDTDVTPGVEYYYGTAVTFGDGLNGTSVILPAIPLANNGYYVLLNGYSGLALSGGNGATTLHLHQPTMATGFRGRRAFRHDGSRHKPGIDRLGNQCATDIE